MSSVSESSYLLSTKLIPKTATVHWLADGCQSEMKGGKFFKLLSMKNLGKLGKCGDCDSVEPDLESSDSETEAIDHEEVGSSDSDSEISGSDLSSGSSSASDFEDETVLDTQCDPVENRDDLPTDSSSGSDSTDTESIDLNRPVSSDRNPCSNGTPSNIARLRGVGQN